MTHFLDECALKIHHTKRFILVSQGIIPFQTLDGLSYHFFRLDKQKGIFIFIKSCHEPQVLQCKN